MAKAAVMAPPPEVPPMMSKVRPDCSMRLVEADVGRTVGAAAAGDEAERRAADEAVEPLDVADVVERHVVMHGDVARRQPARRAGDGAVRLVQQDQALRVGRQQLCGQPLQRIGLLVGGMHADGEHQVGLADRLLRPGRQLRLGDEQHIVVLGLERIERPRRLGAVDADRRGQHRLGHLRPHQDRCGCCAGTPASGRR